jgi:hypothetical protein
VKGGRVRLETVGLRMAVAAPIGVAIVDHRATEELVVTSREFTGRRWRATIDVGATVDSGRRVHFVRDDGVGFDRVPTVEGVAS